MRSAISISIFLFVFSPSFAQNIVTDTSAPVVAYWNKGDKKEFVIRKLTSKIQGKNVTKSDISYRALLTVIDSTADGYTIEWIYKYDFKKQIAIQGFEDLFNDLKIVYTTDDVGSFKELVNYQDIKSFMEKAITAYSKTIKDTAGMSMIINQVKRIFSSRESIEQLVLREINLYHTPYGAEFTVSKVQQETELPNFLGGDPWPGIISIGVLQLNPKQNNARLYMDLEIDKSKGTEIMKEFVRKIASSAGKEPSNEELSFLVQIKDHSEFDLLLDSGWLKRAYVKRIVKAGDYTKEETTSVEIK
jgi:hypothetical protein